MNELNFYKKMEGNQNAVQLIHQMVAKNKNAR